MANNVDGSNIKTVKPGSIDEALKLLDDALERQTTPPFGALVEKEYSQLKTSFLNEPAIREITATASEVAGAFKQVSGAAYSQAAAIAVGGYTQSREFSLAIDREVRANPWLFIGGAAAAALALGYLLSQETQSEVRQVSQTRRRRKPTRDMQARTAYHIASRGARA